MRWRLVSSRAGRKIHESGVKWAPQIQGGPFRIFHRERGHVFRAARPILGIQIKNSAWREADRIV